MRNENRCPARLHSAEAPGQLSFLANEMHAREVVDLLKSSHPHDPLYAHTHARRGDRETRGRPLRARRPTELFGVTPRREACRRLENIRHLKIGSHELLMSS